MLASEEYVETGYFVDADYVGGIASATADTTTPYVEEGYIETGYFREGGGAFSMSVTLTKTPIEGSATVNTVASFAATATRVRFGDITLNNIANLNAQAAITRATSSNLSSEFAMGHDDGGFQPNVEPTVDFEGSATLNSTSTLTTSALIVKFGSATLNSTASLTSTPIEYRSKWLGATRPIDFSVVRWNPNSEAWVSDTNFSFDSSVKKYGTHSLKLHEHTGFTHRSAKTETLGLGVSDRGKDWAVDFWFQTDYVDADENAMLSVSSNSSNNPFPGYQEDPGSVTSDFDFVVYHDGGRLKLRAQNNSGTFILGSSSASYDISSNTWYHIQVIYDQSASTLTLKRGTNTVATLSGSFDNYWTGNTSLFLHNPQQSANPAGSVYSDFFFDELHFRVGNNDINSAGYSYGDFDDTRVLAHFDGNFNDDLAVELDGAATIDSVASVSATLGGTINASATLNTNAGFTLNAVATKVGETVLNVVASATISGDRVRIADSTQNSAFGIAADALRIRTASATLSGTGGFAVDAVLTRKADAELTATFGLTATGTTNKLGEADLSTQFSTSIVGDRIRLGSSTQNATTSLTSTGVANRNTSAVLDTNAGFVITAVATKVGETQLDAVATMSTTGDRFRGVTATITATASASAVPTRISPIVIDADCSSTLTATPVVTRSASSTLTAEHTLTALTGAVFQGSATLPGFTAVISVNKILHVDQFVYVIPSESRTYTIPAETRTHSVTQENRTYTIEG